MHWGRLLYFFITVGIFSAVFFHYGWKILAGINPAKRCVFFYLIIFHHNSDKVPAKPTAKMGAKNTSIQLLLRPKISSDFSAVTVKIWHTRIDKKVQKSLLVMYCTI
jgi:hypothetical protein